MNKLILITSAALEQALMGSGFSEDTMHPRESDDVVKVVLSEEITGYRAKVEGQGTYFALVNVGCLENLYVHDVKMQDAYRRIARVVTSMQTPPCTYLGNGRSTIFETLWLSLRLPETLLAIVGSPRLTERKELQGLIFYLMFNPRLN